VPRRSYGPEWDWEVDSHFYTQQLTTRPEATVTQSFRTLDVRLLVSRMPFVKSDTVTSSLMAGASIPSQRQETTFRYP